VNRSMPLNALDNVAVDYKLPADEIGPLLARLVREPAAAEPPVAAPLVARMRAGLGTGRPVAWGALGLLALWIVTQWAPLVPSLDWQSVKDNLKPLLLQPGLDAPIVLLAAARVLAAGCLFAAARPGRHAGALTFGLLLALVLAGKPFIVGQAINRSNVLGFAAGYAGWLFAMRRSEQHRLLTALVLLFVGYSVSALTPLEFRAAAAPFHWLPFEEMLEGSLELNTRALIDAVFIYATLLWLVQQYGGRVAGSSVVLAAWVALIELAQMWIEGRTADITDPLLVLVIGMLMRRGDIALPQPVRRRSGRRSPAHRQRSRGSSGSVH